MTLTVDRVEPWGTFSDYCGDGSCGVSRPDDTRLALRYTISVPEDLGHDFDASACPGELHSMHGNDEDALISVAGDYYRALGEVRSGAEKYGVVEYSIAKDSADDEFYLDSDCGSVFPMSDADFEALSEDRQGEVLDEFDAQQQQVTFIGRLPNQSSN